MSEATRGRGPAAAWGPACTGIVAVLVIFLAVIAYRMAIDYYDSFEILLNARSIADGGRSGYSKLRSMLMPAALSPYFAAERMLAVDGFGFAAARLTAVAFYALLIAAFYKLLRLDLSAEWAAVGSLALALNPLLIHNAPTVKEDVPAAVFTTLAFYFYLKGSKAPGSRRLWAFAGVCIAAAGLARYNLFPCVVAVIAANEILSGKLRIDDQTFAKVWTMVLLPGVLVGIAPMVVYPLVQVAPWWKAPAQFVEDFLMIRAITASYAWEPPSENVRFLVKSLTPPLAACAVLGGALAWRRRTPSTVLLALWLAGFLVFHSYAITHKEARYLYPLFPPVYFFAVRGLQAVAEALTARLHGIRRKEWVATILVALLMAEPARLAWQECRRFADPIYTENFERRVSLDAKELAGGRRIHWVGPLYAIHPAEYLFDAEDEYTSVYHLAPHVVEFYAGEKVGVVEVLSLTPPPDGDGPVRLHPRDVTTVEDGDALIVNLEKDEYVTKNLPSELAPLVVQRLRVLEMSAESREPGRVLFTCSSATGSSVEIL
jgi:hypothetical protein